MSEASDPLRRLARESGRLLAELGVRSEDEAWARLHADALGSLTTPERRRRLPRLLERLWRRIERAAR